MVRIGIDAYGGDYGCNEVVSAVVKYFNKNADISYVLLGDQNQIADCFNDLKFDYNNSRIKIINATEKIDMNDHPVFSLRNKSNSSIMLGGNGLLNNEYDVFVSAGNTGALVALAQFYLKPIKGIDRPVIASILPTLNNNMLLADSGCNVDSKPEWLYQYAKLCNIYIKKIFNIEKPKIGLLSVGTEENKGNALTLEAYKLIKNDTDLNFIGNVEARDVPFGICDILICDGFAGNVFLKTYEGTAKLFLKLLKDSAYSNLLSKLGALLLFKSIKKNLKKFDTKIYGGAPILGSNFLIVKCHGNSKAEEYINGIISAYDLVKKEINKYIKMQME